MNKKHETVVDKKAKAIVAIKSVHAAFDEWCKGRGLKFWHDMHSGNYLYAFGADERMVLQDTTIRHKQSGFVQLLLDEPFTWREKADNKQGYTNCRYTFSNIEKLLPHLIERHAFNHKRCINELLDHYQAIDISAVKPMQTIFGKLFELDYEMFVSCGISKGEADTYALAWSEALAKSLYTAGMYPDRKMRLMFIIHSPQQEIGKDMFCEALSPNPAWYTDSITIDDFMNKDSSELCRRLRGVHVTAFSDSSAGQKNKAKLKKAISARELTERIMYKANTRKQYRTDVMMMTSNEVDLIPADNEHSRYHPLFVRAGYRFDSEKAAKAYLRERINEWVAYAKYAVDELDEEARLPAIAHESHQKAAHGISYKDESMEVRIKDTLAATILGSKNKGLSFFPVAHFQRQFAEANKNFKPSNRALAQICEEVGVGKSRQIRLATPDEYRKEQLTQNTSRKVKVAEGKSCGLQRVRSFNERAVAWADDWTNVKNKIMSVVSASDSPHDHTNVH